MIMPESFVDNRHRRFRVVTQRLIFFFFFMSNSGQSAGRTAVARQCGPQSDGTLFVHSVQRRAAGRQQEDHAER